MNFPRLWTTSQELTPNPFRAIRREMANVLLLRAFRSEFVFSRHWGWRAGDQRGRNKGRLRSDG